MKLYLLDKTYILFIEDLHIVPQKECAVPDSPVLWVHNFIETILNYSGPTQFFLEHSIFYKNFEEGQIVDVFQDDSIGIGKTQEYFDRCLRNETYDCRHTIHSINNMEFRRFSSSKYNLTLSSKVLNIELPLFQNRQQIIQMDLSVNNSVFDVIYLYFYNILRSLSINEAGFIELDELTKQHFIRLLTKLKINFINLLDALFNKDVDNFIDCLLSFRLTISDHNKVLLNSQFKTDETRKIYKKILKQLSNESIYDKKSNSELLTYFTSKIDDIINNTELERLIHQIDKLSSKDYSTVYTYMREILEYLKRAYLHISSSIFDIYNLKRYLRQMPTDESVFKLVIIYAGRYHTRRYIDFFNNTRQDFSSVIETNETDDGCTTLTKVQLDTLNRTLGNIKDQYDKDNLKLTKFLNEEDIMTDVKYKFNELLNYNLRTHISLIKKNITELKDEIIKIKQKPHYDISEYQSKTELLEYLILYKKQQLLTYVRFRNKLRNQKKIISQNPQETKKLDRDQAAAVAVISPTSPESAAAAAATTTPASEEEEEVFTVLTANDFFSGYNSNTWFYHCY